MVSAYLKTTIVHLLVGTFRSGVIVGAQRCVLQGYAFRCLAMLFARKSAWWETLPPAPPVFSVSSPLARGEFVSRKGARASVRSVLLLSNVRRASVTSGFVVSLALLRLLALKAQHAPAGSAFRRGRCTTGITAASTRIVLQVFARDCRAIFARSSAR